MTSRTGNRSAFTLIEVLLTVTILAIGMIGVLRAYSTMISAMETAQYNMDAACLLKAKMGGIEEAAVTAKGAVPSQKSGVITPRSDIRADSDYPCNWDWSENTAKAEIASIGKVKKELNYHLNTVTLSMVNASRSPSRKVDITTYMRSVKTYE